MNAPAASSTERCSACGLEIAGGDEGCESRFQAMTARAFEDARFGKLHSMTVDIYALQHPDKYCVSAKSLAAHLCGLCAIIERDQPPSPPNMALRAWLDGEVDFDKPDLPHERGSQTIASVADFDDPSAYEEAVWAWGRDVWAAYAPLHGLARQWLDRAEARPDRKQHSRQGPGQRRPTRPQPGRRR